MQNIILTEKKWNIIKHKNLSPHIKMSKEILMLGDIEIKNHKFYRYKCLIFFRRCRH